MERLKITLSIPKDLLIRARRLAIDKQTSLSGLLTKTLEELVSSEDCYREAQARQFKLLEKGFDFGLEGKIEWTRDEIHER